MIASVFKMFPESILPVFLQIPIAVWIGMSNICLGMSSLSFSTMFLP